MKRFVSILMTALIVATAIPFVSSAEEYDNVLVLDIDGYDCLTTDKGIVIYPNNTSSPRDVSANTYNFRNTKLMVFTADGRLTFPDTSQVNRPVAPPGQ